MPDTEVDGAAPAGGAGGGVGRSHVGTVMYEPAMDAGYIVSFGGYGCRFSPFVKNQDQFLVFGEESI